MTSLGEATNTNAVARCVFPVPELPSRRTFSRSRYIPANQQLTYRVLDDRVFVLVTFIDQSFVDALGSMSLLLRRVLALFGNLLDVVHVGFQLRLPVRLRQPVTRRTAVIKYLFKRPPVNAGLAKYLAFVHAIAQHL